ncbi:hypothetical protein IFM89_029001 [Coptis chinensis]|uniref:Uncharacterized protein n=1 Tax=Coptis chinensis TaxID=261450 RepID=A0A835M252_9MAGN|nr:hypothetical protein IFM89_029001 [Coptis chinensis]
MSSRRGGEKPSFAGAGNSSSKGKSASPHHGYSSGGSGASNTSVNVNQLSHNVADINLSSGQDGNWEIKKSKNRGGGNAKQWGPKSSTPNAWSQPNVVQKLGMTGNDGTGKTPRGAWQTTVGDSNRSNGRGNGVQNYNRNFESMPPPTVIQPPLQQGWQWGARAGSSTVTLDQKSVGEEDSGSDSGVRQQESDYDDDFMEDEDDDVMSDDFDSDGSTKSHDTRKKHRWFKAFFEALDKLTIEELNEPSRPRHCPACRNGPGAIDWYRGLQPLVAHAKTKGSTRVKIHRELAELLDEEMNRRGTSVIPSGEVFGKWEGLRKTVSDREIVWPPMIVVMNTQLEMDENDQKWLGMGNQELLDYFSAYGKAVKARHSYGPKGHRGMSILIFESSAMGYQDAERLHKHFASQGTDRNAWENKRVLFYPGGKRQLYGYLARKEDLDNFNRHCAGKTKLKFEMRSYQEMVDVPMKQMSEDNQQLVWLKNKIAREQKHSKALEESLGVVSAKLRKTTEENRIVRQRTKLQHEQNKEEMDYQEQFFNEQMSISQKALEEKEKAFEELQQEARKKMEQSTANSKTQEDEKHKREEIAKFIQSQTKGIKDFEAEREILIKMHEDEKAEMKLKHMEEELQLEKKFETSLTRLMEKYAPPASEEVSTATS